MSESFHVKSAGVQTPSQEESEGEDRKREAGPAKGGKEASEGGEVLHENLPS